MSANTNIKQVAIVSDPSSGVGVGITQALLEHAYRVIANSRTISKSKDLQPTADLVLVDGDISKKKAALKLVDAAVSHLDHIDLLQPKPIIERQFETEFLDLGVDAFAFTCG